MENLKIIKDREEFKRQLKEKLVKLEVGNSIQVLVGKHILTILRVSDVKIKIISKELVRH